MPLWILFFTALTLALHSVPAEAPEPEPSAPVEVVLTEPVFRRSGESHRPVGRNLSHPSVCHTKKSPACRKARSRRGICFFIKVRGYRCRWRRIQARREMAVSVSFLRRGL